MERNRTEKSGETRTLVNLIVSAAFAVILIGGVIVLLNQADEKKKTLEPHVENNDPHFHPYVAKEEQHKNQINKREELPKEEEREPQPIENKGETEDIEPPAPIEPSPEIVDQYWPDKKKIPQPVREERLPQEVDSEEKKSAQDEDRSEEPETRNSSDESEEEEEEHRDDEVEEQDESAKEPDERKDSEEVRVNAMEEFKNDPQLIRYLKEIMPERFDSETTEANDIRKRFKHLIPNDNQTIKQILDQTADLEKH